MFFSILNSYARRTSRDARVIGTLLGEVQRDGTVVVSCDENLCVYGFFFAADRLWIGGFVL